jgi:hypothetical protein
MNINEFLEMAEMFFAMKHPNYCEDYIEEHNESELWDIIEEFFQQIHPQV